MIAQDPSEIGNRYFQKTSIQSQILLFNDSNFRDSLIKIYSQETNLRTTIV